MRDVSRVLPHPGEHGERRLRRMVQGRDLRFLMRAGAMALMTAALTAAALAAAASLAADRGPSTQASATRDTTPPWVEINHPIALYDLSGTDFSKLKRSYRARRRGADGLREDFMTFGALGDGKPYLEVSLLRTADEEVVTRRLQPAGRSGDDLADDLASLAGLTGATLGEVRGVGSIATRLGSMDVVTVTLRDQGIAASCLGFEGALRWPGRTAGGWIGLRVLQPARRAGGIGLRYRPDRPRLGR